MGYNEMETGLRDVIRMATGYTGTSDAEANVTKGDYRVLGLGVAKAVILVPGPFTKESVAIPR